MTSAIAVENLSKKYIIGHQKQERYTALRDVLANGAKRIAHKLAHPFAAPQNDPAHEEFWALKDVSFDIQQGDQVGIIGRNLAARADQKHLIRYFGPCGEGKFIYTTMLYISFTCWR